MKTKEELWKEVQGRGWETIVDVIQRDAFQAGAEAMRNAIRKALLADHNDYLLEGYILPQPLPPFPLTVTEQEKPWSH